MTSRAKLKPRRGPYWQRDSKGCFVGFRKMTTASGGTWWPLHRDDATGKRTEHALGALEEHPDHQRFDKATNAARAWFDHLGKGGSAAPTTIKDVCERYVAHQRNTKPQTALTEYAIARRGAKGKTGTASVRAADDAEARFENYVLDDKKFAATEVSKLTPAMLEKWRMRLQTRPTESGGNRGQARTASTLNRDMSCFRAALNLAFVDGLVTSDFAWRGKLLPIKDADQRRELYLDKDQRRKLIEKAPLDLAAFLRGLSLLPLRPGALAALTVSNFDKRLGVLTVGTDKAGRDRKLKMPKDTATVLEAASKDKLPAAPLFARADGRTWDRHAWKWPVKAAVKAAELPAGVTAYVLRHSTISDLVHGGLDLLTVAQISGTSVRMIEQHYGHLRGDVAADALAKLAL